MGFAHPELLWFMLVPAGMLVLQRQLRTRVPLPFDHAGTAGRSSGRERLLDAFDAVPLFLMVVAVLVLAGPIGREAAPARRRMTNIEICLDVSLSMSWAFDRQELPRKGEASRYELAMGALQEFTTRRKGDAFGLTVFGNNVLHWLPLTQHLECIANAAPFVAPGKMSDDFQGTAAAKALRACQVKLLERDEGDRMVILISDADSSDLARGGAEAVAAELCAADIAAYVVYVGSFAVPSTCSTLARVTGGQAFAVGDPSGLEAVFRRIDAMRPMQYESPRREPVHEFAWTGWAGLGAMLCFVLHSLRWRYTPW